MKNKTKIILFLILIIGVCLALYFSFKKENTNNNEEEKKTAITDTFEADIYLYTKEEGGRITPIFDNYQPQILLENLEINTKKFQISKEKLTPGEEDHITIVLSKETEIQVGEKFIFREGGKKTGTGTITKIISSK